MMTPIWMVGRCNMDETGRLLKDEILEQYNGFRKRYPDVEETKAKEKFIPWICKLHKIRYGESPSKVTIKFYRIYIGLPP